MALTIANAQITEVSVFRPSMTIWSRLEVLPTSADYAPALAAAVADPLWLMTRQWQFNEFAGEDAGSPIDVRLQASQSPLQRFHPGMFGTDPAGSSINYDPLAAPLEALVEVEPSVGPGFVQSARAGRHFLRMLEASGVDDIFSGRPEFALSPPAVIDPVIDQAGAHWRAMLSGRSIDGHKLATAIAEADGIPVGFAIVAAQQVDAKSVCLEWLDWARGSLGVLPASSWRPERLEYSFATNAHDGTKEVVLESREYTDGRLDWYQFDVASRPSLGIQTSRTIDVPFNPMLPSPARFGGMPSDRFWEFEDARVNLAEVNAGPTDIGRMLLLEFALAFGNDWFVVPVDLPVGSLFRIKNFTVKDTFGVETNIRPVANASGSQWRVFELSGSPGANADGGAGLFCLAPTIGARLEGDPIEEVALFRDEMANMAWAVERRVQGASGLPIDRALEASQRVASQRLADLSNVTAELIYRVATPVPEHWLPFVPVPRAGEIDSSKGIVLERRAMLRHLPDGSREAIMPTGLLVRTDPTQSPQVEPRLQVEDEEIPREGAVLTRTHQFTRWINGERLMWTGIRKAVGKGEGASGLRYDVRLRRADVAQT
jgi:hypothetical protein